MNQLNQFDKTRQHKRNQFLVAFAECGNISGAARIAKCDRTSHYIWMEDPEYVKQFEIAKEQAIQELELVARERARKSSDLLLIFLLRSLRPDVYKDRREVENKGAIDLNVKDFAQYLELKAKAEKELNDAKPTNRIANIN